MHKKAIIREEILKHTIKEQEGQIRDLRQGRKITEKGQTFQIREKTESYKPLFEGEEGNIAPENAFKWRQVAR